MWRQYFGYGNTENIDLARARRNYEDRFRQLGAMYMAATEAIEAAQRAQTARRARENNSDGENARPRARQRTATPPRPPSPPPRPPSPPPPPDSLTVAMVPLLRSTVQAVVLRKERVFRTRVDERYRWRGKYARVRSGDPPRIAISVTLPSGEWFNAVYFISRRGAFIELSTPRVVLAYIDRAAGVNAIEEKRVKDALRAVAALYNEQPVRV